MLPGRGKVRTELNLVNDGANLGGVWAYEQFVLGWFGYFLRAFFEG